MASFLSNLTKVAKSKVANISLPSFIDNSDADHADNEDDTAVSRALRDYYKERDGFVPEWLSTITTSFMATATPPPPRPSEGAPAPSGMLGDIFSGETPRQGTTPPPPPQQLRRPSAKPQSVSPVYPQQYPPPPGPPAQPQMASQSQMQPPQQPQRQPVGLPSTPNPRGGVKPFMALRREQQQRHQTAPPQTYQQPPPPPAPPREHSYSGGSTQHHPSNNTRQQHAPPPPPQGYSSSSSSGRSRFADAAGEPRRPSVTPSASSHGSRSTQSSTDKPFVSATAPWANSADNEFGGGWGASPGFYGR
ncbi:hypothetical protein ABW21_db0207431 [Orbilia brochopaga]|nr:hypothetical protein ABW21_db0207431 [Drechslerella brochopaga]